MAGEIAQAFVRVRADTSSFHREVETGVKSALVSAGKTAAGVFGGFQAVNFLKDITKAAAEHKIEFAVLDRQLTNVSAATKLYGQSIEGLLEKEARLKGFHDEELAQSFGRLVTVSHNSAKAFKDLQLAEDIARARHVDLAYAALSVSKAEQGSVLSFQRLGIVVPKVTAHVDALRLAHDHATAAGVKFQGTSAIGYKQSLERAKALDAEARKVEALKLVTDRFGGSSATFAGQAEGRLERFGQQFHQLSVAVGSQVLPLLTEGASRAEVFARSLTDSGQAGRAAHEVMSSLGEGLHVLGAGIQLVAPGIELIVHGLHAVESFTGIGGILIFTAAVKGIPLVSALATNSLLKLRAAEAAGAAASEAAALGLNSRAAAQKAYAATLAGEQTAQEKHTAALEANTAALNGNSSAKGAAIATQDAELASIDATTAALKVQNTVRAQTLGETLFGVPTRQRNELGQFTKDVEREGGVLRSAGRSAVGAASGVAALAGGWQTLGIVAAGAAAFGIYKLLTAETATEQATRRLVDANDALATSFRRTEDLSKRLGDLRLSIPAQEAAVAQDKLNVSHARSALATTQAAIGSAKYLQLVIDLKSAQATLAQAEQSLADARRDERNTIATLNAQHRITTQRLDDEIGKTRDLVKVLREAEAERRRQSLGFGGRAVVGGLSTQTRDSAKSVLEFAKVEEQAARKEFAVHHDRIARADLVLAKLTHIFKAFPSDKTISIVLHAENANQALRKLTQEFIAQRPAANEFISRVRAESSALTSDFPKLAAKLLLLAEYARAIHRTPTRHETELVLRSGNLHLAASALLKVLAQMDKASGDSGKKSGQDFTKSFLAFLPHTGPLASFFKNAAGEAATAAHAAADSLSTLSNKAVENLLKTTGSNVRATGSVIHDAAAQLADSERNLADAIRSGNQQIHDSIISADANLFSLGNSLSDMLGQFIDAQQKASDAASSTGPSEALYRKLRDQILHGQGGPETIKAAQEVSAKIQGAAASHATDTQKAKDSAKRRISDLIYEFNRGAITLGQLNRGIAKVLESDHFTYAKAGKLLGKAFVGGFQAELTGITSQGKAILDVPAGLRKGVTGLEPNVVRPLETIRQVNSSIKDAEKQRHKDALALAKDEAKLAHQRFEQHRLTNELLARGLTSSGQPIPGAHGAAAHLSPARQRIDTIELLKDLDLAKVVHGPHAAAITRDILRLAHELGLTIPKGIQAGIAGGQTSAIKYVERLADELLRALRRKLRSHSPSEATREIGLDIGNGLALGIDQTRPTVKRMLEELVEPIKALKTHVEFSADVPAPRHLGHPEVPRPAAPASGSQETVSELRSHRLTAARGSHELLTEARKQTRILESLERHKPTPNRGGSHAPGKQASAARDGARYRLTT